MSLAPVIQVPKPVLAIHQQLEAAGFETWCVGGAVRDALLRIRETDVDLATAATPAQVRELFPRTIPVGIAHGTVGVLDHLGVLHEVTTFRRDVTTDGRHAVVEFGVSLDDDLARRDFTINAIAWHPDRGEFRDPFDGRGDLERRVVRAVGDPEVRFAEDRLRILRAFRFAARFEFTIEGDTWQAILNQAGDTAHLSAERVREEWFKGVTRAHDPRHYPEFWHESGVAAVWLSADKVHDSGYVGRDPLLALAAWREPVEPILRGLKCSTAEIARGRAIDLGPAEPAERNITAVRLWLSRVGAAADDIMAVTLARTGEPAWWADQVAVIRRNGEPLQLGDLAVSGSDLIAAGVAVPGPELGRLLAALLDAVILDPTLNTPAQLLAVANRHCEPPRAAKQPPAR